MANPISIASRILRFGKKCCILPAWRFRASNNCSRMLPLPVPRPGDFVMVPTTWGAPDLDFETWESTNLHGHSARAIPEQLLLPDSEPDTHTCRPRRIR